MQNKITIIHVLLKNLNLHKTFIFEGLATNALNKQENQDKNLSTFTSYMYIVADKKLAFRNYLETNTKI